MSIDVQPWPSHSSTGQGPFWPVRVEVGNFKGWIAYAGHLGRFTESNELARLRKSSPRAMHAAVAVVEGTLRKRLAVEPNQ